MSLSSVILSRRKQTGARTANAGSSSDFVFNGTSYSASSASSVPYGTNKITVESRLYQTSFSTATGQTYFDSYSNYSSGANRWAIDNDTNGNMEGIAITATDTAGSAFYYYFSGPLNNTCHPIAVALDGSSNSVPAPIVYVNGSSVTLAFQNWASAGSWATNTVYVGPRCNTSQWSPVSIKDVRIWSGAQLWKYRDRCD